MKKKSAQETIIDEVVDLAAFTLKLERENTKLKAQNENYKQGLAKLARKLENDKVRRN